MIEIVMRKIGKSGNITETVLVSLPNAESATMTHDPNILTFSQLEIHLQKQMIFQNGRFISLSHLEFQTLSYLALHPGWVISKEQIYEAVWKEDQEYCGSAVANVISQIRRKIGNGYIETVINSGYKFVG
ncbi:winged helix-turn-helix domain-containing protein [Oliverpabstia intestinalis]|uniref:winged helix-turn-helix domain-containing protein n=2 Tax=Lachnospirales TaxID=3085636 RepID=UPI001F4468A1|nr:winged helix-turn-helix domain-containing protein [Faecalicatena contorta]MCF2683910.1 winged helix-turn-helix transcriptional regulator [Faecalicatena contorta]MCI6432281.1 winged helix-turn-helix domain-containing protein [Lachnospiraceae bacterium]MDY4193247.1 winged helix-turn-helix domain-containing protein [Bariatricus sp.]